LPRPTPFSVIPGKRLLLLTSMPKKHPSPAVDPASNWIRLTGSFCGLERFSLKSGFKDCPMNRKAFWLAGLPVLMLAAVWQPIQAAKALLVSV
jgi:hypothetical protein